MRKLLQGLVVGLSALVLTACFDLVAQSKYVEVDQGSVDNLIVLGPKTTSDGDFVIYTIVSQPSHGTLDESNLPEVVYTPDPDYAGKDIFTFKLSDGEDESNVAKITISVMAPENMAPVAHITVEGEVLVSEGDTVTLSGDTSSDDDGSIVRYEWLEDDVVLHTGSNYEATLPAGSHTITLRVTDDQNATAEERIEIIVEALSAS